MSKESWTEEFLNRAQSEGDALADATISAIYANGQLEAVNQAFDLLLRNDRLPEDRLPTELREFLKTTSTLPEWADMNLIRHAEQFFMSWGLLSVASLSAAGLPECYALGIEARVLGITQRLTTGAPRRVIETAQLVIRVMDEGGLGPTGQGIRAVQKVRLLHAAMRRLIRDKPPIDIAAPAPANQFQAMRAFAWPESDGMPLSQEHLAYTLLTFSYVVPRSLERFGAAVTAEDWKAHLHCWNVVGHVLGLRRDLMVETREEAEWLFSRIKQRHQTDTPEGRSLTRAVTEWMKGMLPFPCLGWVPRLVMWMLLDRDTALSLGVPEPGWFARTMLALYRAMPFALKPDLILGRWLVAHLTELPRGWERELFDLPASLEKKWRIKRKTPKASS